MSKRIEGESALASGGRIAKPIGCNGVGKFMKRQRDKYRGRADEQLQVEVHYDEITFFEINSCQQQFCSIAATARLFQLPHARE